MMKYLDYIFYRFCFWFKKNFGEKGDHALNGFVTISFFECLNWATISMIIETFFKRTFFDSPMGMIIPIIIINIVNFKRYDKIITFEMLEEKWNQESSKSRIKNGVLVILYMFFSTAFLIISGYILYNQPWRMIELLHK